MEHYAEGVVLSSPTVVRRWGIASGRLEGWVRVRENFAMGMGAPGLHLELVDVLMGIGSMCVIYRRETGQLVSDTVELDGAGKIVRVAACYGSAPGS